MRYKQEKLHFQRKIQCETTCVWHPDRVIMKKGKQHVASLHLEVVYSLKPFQTGNLLFSVMLPFKLGLQILLHNSYTRTSFIPSRHCLLTSMTWMSVSSCGESVYCIPPPWPLVHNVRSGRRIFHAHKQMLALKRKRFCKQSSYVWFSEIKR